MVRDSRRIIKQQGFFTNHHKTTTGNYRNGHASNKIKSSFGENQIQVPRDR